MKEEGAVEDFLWIDGKQWIKKKDPQPKKRGAANEREEQLRGEHADGKGKTEEAKGVAQQKMRKKRADKFF